MNFFKVGIVDFFGILCPGVLLLMNLILLLVACQVDFIKSIDLRLLERLAVGLFIFFFVICYLFGFILRLFSPDIIDKISTIFNHYLFPWRYSAKRKLRKEFKIKNKDRKWNRREFKKRFNEFLNSLYEDNIKKRIPLPKFFWAEDKYPYYQSLKCILNFYFPAPIKNRLLLGKFYNKVYISTWKTIIVSKDNNLAALVYQAEALVRFMSGTFWALVVGIIAGFLIIISGLKSGSDISMGLFLTLVSLFMSIIILLKFKDQRRREVLILLTAIDIVSQAENRVVSANNISEQV